MHRGGDAGHRPHIGRMDTITETYSDTLLGFSLPERDARGRAVRLDDVADLILSAHAYPRPVAKLLEEALVLAALIGGAIDKGEGQMTLQAQSKGGAVTLLVCDYKGGQLRGYADFDEDAVAALPPRPDLQALFGEGHLAITFDMNDERGRYQGIVPLEGPSLTSACQHYFIQSEQVPTIIRTAVSMEADGARAGGLLIQHLPDGEEGRERLHVRLDNPHWEHVSILGGSVQADELLDPDLSMEAIVWRLFHEEKEVRVLKGAKVSRGCRCSVEHYEAVIARFPENEQAQMRDDDGNILVDCAFCSKVFTLGS
ncbi:Hsp33 family molecular chaperone [Altererythrobacter sp. MTPC7]